VAIAISDSGTANGRSGEAVWIDDNGHVNVAMTVTNVGRGTATLDINWLSAFFPSNEGVPVAVGNIDTVTLSPDWYFTLWNTDPQFQPGQWYRAAPFFDHSLTPVGFPFADFSMVIGDSGTADGSSGETIRMNDNGQVVVAMTVKNVSQVTAFIGVSWLAAQALIPARRFWVFGGDFYHFTLSPNWYTTVIATDPPGEHLLAQPWSRLAPSLDVDNSPGVAIVIGDSGTANGRSGEAVAAGVHGIISRHMTVTNVGQAIAAVRMSYLSAPGREV
jgi:hypothetical protein